MKPLFHNSSLSFNTSAQSGKKPPHCKLPLEPPREKGLRQGVEALSVEELLALILGTGTKEKNVLTLAHELLVLFGGIKGLLEASIEELLQVKGMGRAKALQVKAACMLGNVVAKKKIVIGSKMSSITDVLELAIPLLSLRKQEALLVILRDVKGRLLHHEIVALGTLSEVLVHPREIFYLAIRHLAHSLILCHNHPSGDPRPSEADHLLTKKLRSCAELMGIALVDHLVIAGEKYTSLITS